jgi:hypothetical protein
MKLTAQTSAPEYGAAVEAGPILSARDGATTTIWRDGSVVREERDGAVRILLSTTPIFTSAFGS